MKLYNQELRRKSIGKSNRIGYIVSVLSLRQMRDAILVTATIVQNAYIEMVIR